MGAQHRRLLAVLPGVPLNQEAGGFCLGKFTAWKVGTRSSWTRGGQESKAPLEGAECSHNNTVMMCYFDIVHQKERIKTHGEVWRKASEISAEDIHGGKGYISGP